MFGCLNMCACVYACMSLASTQRSTSVLSVSLCAYARACVCCKDVQNGVCVCVWSDCAGVCVRACPAWCVHTCWERACVSAQLYESPCVRACVINSANQNTSFNKFFKFILYFIQQDLASLAAHNRRGPESSYTVLSPFILNFIQ